MISIAVRCEKTRLFCVRETAHAKGFGELQVHVSHNLVIGEIRDDHVTLYCQLPGRVSDANLVFSNLFLEFLGFGDSAIIHQQWKGPRMRMWVFCEI